MSQEIGDDPIHELEKSRHKMAHQRTLSVPNHIANRTVCCTAMYVIDFHFAA